MASPRNPNEVQIQNDEFTKEQVLALLRDTTETGNYNTRGKIERMAHIIKRLKACVEWFQKAEETHVQEKETLQAIISKLGKEESSKQVTSLKEDDTYHKLQVYNSSLQEYNVILQTDLESVRDRLTCAEREKSLILENLASVSGHNKSLQCQLASSQASQDDAIRQKHLLLSEVTNLQSELDKQVAHSQKLDEEGYGKSSESLEERIQILEQQILEGESLRKKLHNTILELKGNIRVFCRVRPLLPDDAGQNEARVIAYPTSTNVELIHNGNNYLFSFDKVFNHEASQGEIFLEISELVHSVFDGFKVCIFAYGQTGSGKTYTMMGGPENPEQKGLIPRSLDLIFKTSQLLVAQGWKYKMQISMLEIVSETIQDLLSTSKTSCMQFVRADSVTPGKRYNIKHDANGSTHVSDLTILDVCSAEEISSLLQQANQSRSVGKTNMNEESSRSHFVFTLRISGVNEKTGQQVHGVLNLIDLAGSERVSKSGATGDRLKETQAINKSLSALTDVISALAKKEDHVPFRNSKLTYLLQPCLEGDAKALMFVNVSPDPSSSGESLCSLRFATRVNACELGKLKRQGDKLQGSSRKRKEAL